MFCAKYNVHVFLIAHPTKIPKDIVTKKHNIPTLYDISDSAHFYNKAFNGICVYRNFDTNTVDVHVQKVKFKWVGKTGMVSFTYDIPSGRYTEVGDKMLNEMVHVNNNGDEQFNDTNKKIVSGKFTRPVQETLVYHEPKKENVELDDNGKAYAF